MSQKQKPTAESRGWTPLYEELAGESERAAALVGCAMLDDVLAQLLTGFFVEESAKKVEELFGQYGPLGTFAAKISLAYCLGLITVDWENDLTTIRKVRNAFAHGLGQASFQNDSVVSLCNNLVASKRFPPSDTLAALSPARQQFIAAVGMLVYMLGLQVGQVSLHRRQPLTIAPLRLGSLSDL